MLTVITTTSKLFYLSVAGPVGEVADDVLVGRLLERRLDVIGVEEAVGLEVAA